MLIQRKPGGISNGWLQWRQPQPCRYQLSSQYRWPLRPIYVKPRRGGIIILAPQCSQHGGWLRGSLFSAAAKRRSWRHRLAAVALGWPSETPAAQRRLADCLQWRRYLLSAAWRLAGWRLQRWPIFCQACPDIGSNLLTVNVIFSSLFHLLSMK